MQKNIMENNSQDWLAIYLGVVPSVLKGTILVWQVGVAQCNLRLSVYSFTNNSITPEN